jgi:Zn-dependent peptidase ImmA (M78 family)
MRQVVSGINPRILIWARERANLTVDEVATAMGLKNAATVSNWETGAEFPTYVQLEKLAYSVLKRPIALFFFPDPPTEINTEQEFRTVPTPFVIDLEAHTLYRIREARATVISLYELSGGVNSSARKIFRDVSIQGDSPKIAAAKVRDYLGISLDEQTRVWRDTDEALKRWREAIESVGVFVFKDTFKQDSISGFALHDPEFPIIYLNNSTTSSRQIFTLFHELSHLLLQVSGITREDERQISTALHSDNRTETYCNRFAAEFLVPGDNLQATVTSSVSEELLQRLARVYKVSRAVVLLKLVDLGIASQSLYDTFARSWSQNYERAAQADESRGGGGNYYLTQRSYLSDRYTKLAFSKYYQGNITVEQLAGYLGMKAKNVSSFEAYAFERRAV